MWPVHMGAQQMALNARAVDRALERISGSILILFVGKYLWLINISPKVLLSLRAGLWFPVEKVVGKSISAGSIGLFQPKSVVKSLGEGSPIVLV
jgi:hypothetical protein